MRAMRTQPEGQGEHGQEARGSQRLKPLFQGPRHLRQQCRGEVSDRLMEACVQRALSLPSSEPALDAILMPSMRRRCTRDRSRSPVLQTQTSTVRSE